MQSLTYTQGIVATVATPRAPYFLVDPRCTYSPSLLRPSDLVRVCWNGGQHEECSYAVSLASGRANKLHPLVRSLVHTSFRSYGIGGLQVILTTLFPFKDHNLNLTFSACFKLASR
eukprot:3871984-Amphidinium_carterae.2